MNSLRKYRVIAAIVFMLLPAEGYAMENNAPWKSMKLVGEGKLSFLFWDIYYARLYSADGRYQEQAYPLALELTYLRDFTKQQLVEETAKQWKKLGFEDETKTQTWLSRLSELWPDVEEKQSITLYIDNQNRSFFYFNAELLGQIDDAEFSQAFLAIWLSEDTSAPEVRKKLIASL
ncbi:chalcone isomerase family protein [Planctobacterium marinum]|uniref:Chalcone isomerase domain-containing protein n=1 Tax=Planctobacterium marinum TaxID=1631968 RepID=A0AA48HV36_9ALTE|nr:hypothetical protein MACH26_40400 [Planctobacterium marinum]